jgi:hypothetical protein
VELLAENICYFSRLLRNTSKLLSKKDPVMKNPSHPAKICWVPIPSLLSKKKLFVLTEAQFAGYKKVITFSL